MELSIARTNGKSLSTNERASSQYYPDIELRGGTSAIVNKVNTRSRQKFASKQWTPRWSTAVCVYGIGYAGDKDKDMFDQKFSRCLWRRFPIPYRKTLWFDCGIDIAFSVKKTSRLLPSRCWYLIHYAALT
ncbi:hypothetical protein O9929_27260 [Vibrio lentus]|nr:hypothetical protein [Vibrio lentus]